ncbi:MAG TPA: response regulator [Gammaproteobacteria bacterium]|nr:response regulator [Gammaproteobacteria bacterium]
MNGPTDVLVVEDDLDMQEVMLRLLRLAGYAARGAPNGLEALKAVAERRPALVLLDMLMPVMDGWQCARELRARYGPSLPIVVVSAAEHAHARGLEIGADEVLAKPFELKELLRVVSLYAPKGIARFET